jgi:hypothetical protein
VTAFPLKAALVDDINAGNLPPGAIAFIPKDEPEFLMFRCPCGCGLPGSLRLKGEYSWEWNGSQEAPTCRPSVGFYGHNQRSEGHHWHGWLTDGEWRLA